jgi:hypothetical protein
VGGAGGDVRSAEESLQLGFEPTREAFARFFGRSESRFAEGGFIFRAWTGHVEGTQGVTAGIASEHKKDRSPVGRSGREPSGR